MGWLSRRRAARERAAQIEAAERAEKKRQEYEREREHTERLFSFAERVAQGRYNYINAPFAENGGKVGRLINVGVRDHDNAPMLLIQCGDVTEMFVLAPRSIRLTSQPEGMTDVPQAP